MLIISFPHNPTTEVVDIGFFERVVKTAKEHGFLVIHDLAYADLTFDGYEAPSFLQVPGAKDVGVEFFSLVEKLQYARMARRLLRRQQGSHPRLGADQELSRLRDFPTDPDRGDTGFERAAGLRRRDPADV